MINEERYKEILEEIDTLERDIEFRFPEAQPFYILCKQIRDRRSGTLEEAIQMYEVHRRARKHIFGLCNYIRAFTKPLGKIAPSVKKDGSRMFPSEQLRWLIESYEDIRAQTERD